MRIPVWPGVRLSVWEPQNPDAVTITMACYYKPFPVRRVLSKRGWALFLVRYDWRDKGTYQPDPHDELALYRRLLSERTDERDTAMDAIARVRDVIADMEHTTGARHWAQALHRALDPKETDR